MRRCSSFQLVFAVLLALPGVAAATPQAPEAIDQLELNGWSGEVIVDIGEAAEVQLTIPAAHNVALSFEVEHEAGRIERAGAGLMVGLTDDFGMMAQISADSNGRPNEVAAIALAEVERGQWTGEVNLGLRRGWGEERAGHSFDYAWGVRRQGFGSLALGIEGSGRLHASESRRAAGLRGHFVGLGLVLEPRPRRAIRPELRIAVLREARLDRASTLIRLSMQMDLTRVSDTLAGDKSL